MAVIKAVSSKAGIGQALDYVTKEEKTEDKLVSGLHCEPDTVKDEMQATKELWGKTGGRTYKHFVHSYHEDEHITPEQAHKNAVELAKGTEAWKGHEVLIATHIDRGHIHTHFIVNSVNYENGHKLQWSKADLQNLKDRCNEQSRQQGLHVPEKGKTFSGEEREERDIQPLEASREWRSEKLCARYSPCGHGLPRNSHKPRGLHRPDESKGLWCGLARQP